MEADGSGGVYGRAVLLVGSGKGGYEVMDWEDVVQVDWD